VRKGGASWTYTHLWREVPRSAFGAINVLASVESPEEIEVAAAAGYSAAITVDAFPSRKAFKLPGSSFTLVPCPAEVRGDGARRVTCVACRLCLDRDLLALNVAIAFEAHGPQAAKVRDTLVQLRRNRSGVPVASLPRGTTSVDTETPHSPGGRRSPAADGRLPRGYDRRHHDAEHTTGEDQMRSINRPNIISIAVSAEEFAVVDQASRKEGISPAQFVLQRATEAPTPTFTMADYITLREAEYATEHPESRQPDEVAAAEAIRRSLEEGRGDWRELLDVFRAFLKGKAPDPAQPAKMVPCEYYYGPAPLPRWHPHYHRQASVPAATTGPTTLTADRRETEGGDGGRA
jgi:hypothetical protein